MTKALLLVLLLSGCDPADVACAGQRPMSCECVTSCSFADGGAQLDGVLTKMTTEVCLPRCWDRSQ